MELLMNSSINLGRYIFYGYSESSRQSISIFKSTVLEFIEPELHINTETAKIFIFNCMHFGMPNNTLIQIKGWVEGRDEPTKRCFSCS